MLLVIYELLLVGLHSPIIEGLHHLPPRGSRGCTRMKMLVIGGVNMCVDDGVIRDVCITSMMCVSHQHALHVYVIYIQSMDVHPFNVCNTFHVHEMCDPHTECV